MCQKCLTNFYSLASHFIYKHWEVGAQLGGRLGKHMLTTFTVLDSIPSTTQNKLRQ